MLFASLMGCIFGDGLMINFGDVMFLNHYFFQVLDRGEKIELLVDKTENLRSQVGKIEFMPNDTVVGVCGYVLQKRPCLSVALDVTGFCLEVNFVGILMNAGKQRASLYDGWLCCLSLHVPLLAIRWVQRLTAVSY